MTQSLPPKQHRDTLDLVAQAASGSDIAMRRLYETYQHAVYSITRRLSGDDALAEDWAQDAWVRIFAGLRAFRGDSQLSSWIHRIAVNAALNGRRSRARSAGREVLIQDTLRAAEAPEPSTRAVEVFALVDRLPERMRRVLVLYDVEGYSHDEIAALLGTSASNSRSQLMRARTKLRAWAFDTESEE